MRAPLQFLPDRVVVLNVPQTTTMLALGLFTAIFLWPVFLATLVRHVPAEYLEEVVATGRFLRDAMLLVLGYYFAKVVNAGQESITNKAIDLAAQTQPKPGGENNV
jgi:hypothetical protein